MQTWHRAFTRWNRFVSDTLHTETATHEGSTIHYERVYREWDTLHACVRNFLRKAPIHETALVDYCQRMLGSMQSCVDIFMQWITSIDDVGYNLSMLARNISRSHRYDINEMYDIIFEIIKESHTRVSDHLASTIRNMPLEKSLQGIHILAEALSAYFDLWPRTNKTIMHSSMQTATRYLDMIRCATITITDMSRQFSPLYIKDNVYAAEFLRRIEAYGKISQDTSDNRLTHLFSSASGPLQTLQALKVWTHCHFKLLSTSCVIPIKLTQGIGRSLSDMHVFAFEQFIDSPLHSRGPFTHAWNNFRARTINNFTSTTGFLEILSIFVEALTEYVCAAGAVLEDLADIPQHAGAQRRGAQAC